MLDTEVQTTGETAEENYAGEITSEFFETVGTEQAAFPRPFPIPIPIPIPIPFNFGTRFMIWKQDPTVWALGRRLTFMPRLILDGPTDSRITTYLAGTTPVNRSPSGDFIFPSNSKESDCAHTFAVVRQTLTLFERQQNSAPIPWAWNKNGNTDKLTVHPRGFSGANAYYSRNGKTLKFGYFKPQGSSIDIYTCRSLDICSHETGHAILDGLKPGWLGFGNPPQTGGLHESFGDLCAIFLALSQLDQVESLIALTGSNLHKKNFLLRMAEQFGLALGRPMGLRNADNNLKLSQVSNEVHAISQVFTGAIYDILADIFNYEKFKQAKTRGPTHVLLDVGEHLCKLLFDALKSAPDVGATYADVANQMLQISHAQGDPAIYRTFIRNRFTFREIVVSPTPLTAMSRGAIDMSDENFVDGEDVLEMECALPDHPSLVANQDRSGCCGTMQHPEYAQDQKVLDANLKALTEKDYTIDEESILAQEIKELSKTFK